jgi:putative ABC transport system permease protein
VLGAVAALATVLPYSYARTDTVVPDSRPAIDLGIAGVALVITLAASLGTARRGVRTPAVEAVAR